MYFSVLSRWVPSSSGSLNFIQTSYQDQVHYTCTCTYRILLSKIPDIGRRIYYLSSLLHSLQVGFSVYLYMYSKLHKIIFFSLSIGQWKHLENVQTISLLSQYLWCVAVYIKSSVYFLLGFQIKKQASEGAVQWWVWNSPCWHASTGS